MHSQPHQVVILDIDPLVTHHQVLSDAGIDTTIVWHETDVTQLVGGEHRVEIAPDTILHNAESRVVSCACLMLQGTVLAVGVTADRAPPSLLASAI